MELINSSFEIMRSLHPEDLALIERIGRVCYKSEDRITAESYERFLKMIVSNGHESVLEHSLITVKFICDRGVSHELVRHRLASFSQESTRYCNYKGKDMQFIIPSWCGIKPGKYGSELTTLEEQEVYFLQTCYMAEDIYDILISQGLQPQEARAILPNALKTEIVVSANIREWRHILSLRCSHKAHPDMRNLMIPLLIQLKEDIKFVFDDIGCD